MNQMKIKQLNISKIFKKKNKIKKVEKKSQD